MSGDPTPSRPRYSHLLAEPIPMSFASPHQLAQMASTAGGFVPAPRMRASHHSYGTHMPPSPPVHYEGSHTKATAASAKKDIDYSAVDDADFNERDISRPLPEEKIELKTFKGFRFIRVCVEDEMREIYDKISGSFQWDAYDKADECFDAIEEMAENRVFVMSSGTTGEKLVPEIHKLRNVYAIYILCGNVEHHKQWARNFDKVRVVTSLHADLTSLFAVDVAQSNIDLATALIQQRDFKKAEEKLTLAQQKLKKYAPRHDKKMNKIIQEKLEKCK